MRNGKVIIMDDTLREGEQTPGIRYTTESRMIIFDKLVDAGIRTVNVGSPSVMHNLDGILSISNIGYGDVELVGHIGCTKAEVDRSVDKCGLSSLKLYIAPTPDHLEAKFGAKFGDGPDKLQKLQEFCIGKVQESIEHAKSRGVGTISYTPEDITSVMGSKSGTKFAYDAIRTALECGATRISLPDTRGIATPQKIKRMVRDVRRTFGGGFQIEAHLHNDRGLATANAMAAIEAGADIIHTTVNGMGERSGITALEQIAANLYSENIDAGLNYGKIYSLCRTVEELSGFPVSRNSPISGENAFAHTSGRHQGSVVHNPMTYQAFDPKIFGRETTLSFGALSGREGIAGFIRMCGYSEKVDMRTLTEIAESVRDYHARNGVMDVNVVRDMANSKLGAELKVPKSYMENAYKHAYLMIESVGGKNEIETRANIMEGLKNVPYVSRVSEIFGSSDFDYLATLRYSLVDGEEAALQKVKGSLNGVSCIARTEIFTSGDEYKR
jgi:isopropylmalate/homocitrate/citramalate synthase